MAEKLCFKGLQKIRCLLGQGGRICLLSKAKEIRLRAGIFQPEETTAGSDFLMAAGMLPKV